MFLFNAYQASLTIIRRISSDSAFALCVCVGGLMVVSFLKIHCELTLKIFLYFVFNDKETVLSSHTSHMTDSEFIVFLPKLWVPTNFHTGSQETGLS